MGAWTVGDVFVLRRIDDNDDAMRARYEGLAQQPYARQAGTRKEGERERDCM